MIDLTNSFILKGDMTLTVKPGVTVTWDQDNLTGSLGKISVYSDETGSPKMCAIGTKDSLITFQKHPSIAVNREYHRFFFDGKRLKKFFSSNFPSKSP